jgi:hypothetical protein
MASIALAPIEAAFVYHFLLTSEISMLGTSITPQEVFWAKFLWR